MKVDNMERPFVYVEMVSLSCYPLLSKKGLILSL